MQIETFNANPTVNTEPPPSSVGQGRITQTDDNMVRGHEGSPHISTSKPTDGAREATTPKPPGHKEIEAMTDERLNADPEYVALKEKYETWKNVENDFALIDSHSGFITGDGTVTLDNLRAVANDPLADAGARAAAQRLLNNMPVWNEMAKGDNVVGTHDVTEFVQSMKDKLKAMKDTARAEIRAEAGIATPASATAGAAPGASTNPAGSSPLFAASPLSTKPGMEGAVENVNNALTSIGQSMADMMAKITDPNCKPEDRARIQAQYNDLQQLQSMLTKMYTQLQEAIANLMKMYSDVAQNSIRNMK